MRLLISSEAGVQAGAEYLRVIGFVYFVQSQSLIQAAVLKSTEQVKLPMFASLAAICTNVVFNTAAHLSHRARRKLLGLAFTNARRRHGVRAARSPRSSARVWNCFSFSFFPISLSLRQRSQAARTVARLPRAR